MTGAMRRILATVKVFDDNEGAVFILHSSIEKYVAQFSKKNKYYFVNLSFVERLTKDEKYLRRIVNECGEPDVFFSYGIPFFQKFGKTNWFHVSNALSLRVKNIRLSPASRIKMLLLKKRICSTVNNIDVVSGESQFTLDLFKAEVCAKNTMRYHILKNGYSEEDLEYSDEPSSDLNNEKYALTTGIAPYKRLDVVYNIFKALQESNQDLKTLVVVTGQYDAPYIPKLIPEYIRFDNNVVIDTFNRREELIRIMRNMDYYISASQIENSSNALLEGLMFSKYVIASEIPSHVELLAGKGYSYFHEKASGENFILVDNDDAHVFRNSISWEAAVDEMVSIGVNATNSI